jgi:hypothetical protein
MKVCGCELCEFCELGHEFCELGHCEFEF